MFKINETLKQNVINKIPAGYTPLQTCVFVYNYLCSILEYSIDYYANQDIYSAYFTNPNNLEKVDGIKNNKVVCYTFSAIYKTIIEELKLPNVKVESGEELDENGLFKDYHDYMLLKIDNVIYKADATKAVFHDNDLVDQKFENRPLKQFTLSSVEHLCSRTNKQEELKRAIEQVSNDLKLTKIAEQYVIQKGSEYKKLPLEKRYNLFKELLTHTPDYSVSSLNYIHRLKHSLFDESEYKIHYSKDKNKITKQYFQISFVRKALTGELVTLIFYNPKGYLKTCPNFETLEISEFSAKTKTLKNISRNTLYENIVCNMLYEVDGYGTDPVELDSDIINMAVDITPF